MSGVHKQFEATDFRQQSMAQVPDAPCPAVVATDDRELLGCIQSNG